MKRLLRTFLFCLFFSLVSFAQDSNGQLIRLKYRLDVGNSNDTVRYASFSPDGKRVLLVNDNSTQVWSAETGKLILTFPEKISLENGFRFAWQPNGTKILQFDSYTGKKEAAYLWDTENGKLVAVLNEKQEVEQVEWNKSGDRILSVGTLSTFPPNAEVTFSVRDENGQIIRTEHLNSYSLWLVRFSNNGRDIITSEKYNRRKPVRISDAESGATIKSFDQELRKSSFNYAVFSAESPNGKFICGQILESKGVVCWTTAGSESPLYYFLDNKQTGDISFLSFSPDSKSFTISKPKKKVIEIIDAETGKVKTTLENPNKARLQLYANWNPSQQFLAMPIGDSWSPSGKYFVASNFEKEANIWETQTGSLIAKLPLIYDDEHDWFVGTLVTNYETFSFHLSEKVLLSVSNKVVRLWKPETGELLQEIRETDKDKSPRLFQSSIARWSPDGNLLMTAANENKSILLWEVLPIK
jgi:WD40 repeat protein